MTWRKHMLKSEQKKFVDQSINLLKGVLGEAGIAVLDRKKFGEQLLVIGKLYETMNKEEEIL
jgi:hypothetical protein